MKDRVIKYFSAPWCGPCKVFKPIMTEVSNEGFNVQFIDVDDNPQLASQYGVRSVPTCVVEHNGVEIDRWSGTVSKAEVKAKYLQQ
jgi:thioredoxin-like negative regulator of GroEL